MRALFALLLIALPLSAQDSLDAVLAKMDSAASGLNTMSAELRAVKYSSFFGQEEVETGRLLMDRRGTVKDRKLRIDYTTEPPYTLLLNGTKAYTWRPKIQRLEEYDLADSQDRLAEAFSMGFAASGEYLASKYDVSLEGREQAAGAEAIKLVLIPKDPETQNEVRKIEMWVAVSSWQPVQQKVHDAAEGEWRQYSYTKIARNPALTAAAFELDIPKGVKPIKPQK